MAIDETGGQSMNSIGTSIWGAISRPPYHKNPTGQETTIHPKPAVTEYEVFYNKFHQFFFFQLSEFFNKLST